MLGSRLISYVACSRLGRNDIPSTQDAVYIKLCPAGLSLKIIRRYAASDIYQACKYKCRGNVPFPVTSTSSHRNEGGLAPRLGLLQEGIELCKVRKTHSLTGLGKVRNAVAHVLVEIVGPWRFVKIEARFVGRIRPALGPRALLHVYLD
jgi:hypothetical protein